MKLFISVISHSHDDMISSSSTLKHLANEHHVIIKSNTTPSPSLVKYCKENSIFLLVGSKEKGFGANNNEVFHYAKSSLGMDDKDYFLVLNPDVEVCLNSVNQLLELANSNRTDIAAINLYRDINFTTFDNSIRRFPKIYYPLKTIFGMKRTDIYDKHNIEHPMPIEYAAGSFLLFNAQSYLGLGGFNENYYMYFEDADICTRANRNNYKVIYYPNIKAVHFASHQNRNILSKHFIWYIKSSLRYQFMQGSKTK